MNIKVSDPGSPWVKIFFNGTQINDCVEADEENRFVRRYARDEKGNFRRFEPPFETDLVIVKEYGDVRIEL
jgi:hypothetical protein